MESHFFREKKNTPTISTAMCLYGSKKQSMKSWTVVKVSYIFVFNITKISNVRLYYVLQIYVKLGFTRAVFLFRFYYSK